MATFAPVYPPVKHHKAFLARKQTVESRKRKRVKDSSEDEAAGTPSPGQDHKLRTPSSSFRPVNQSDPYHVAGLSRLNPPPPPPFPHAALKEQRAQVAIEEELANLNPPLWVSAPKSEERSSSLKRRHLDNLTTILHQCMLNGEWQRAARAWSLLLRTEVVGRGMDVRRNGRWSIGAELLMRKGVDAQNEGEQFSDEGFSLAKEYYERLILQYPHTPRTQHRFNASAVYPALFNIWIYEVQNRSARDRERLSTPASANASEADIEGAGRGDERSQSTDGLAIRRRELEEALPLAKRMDELILSPPYDTSIELLQLRGMVALWMSDLHAKLADSMAEDMHQSQETDASMFNYPYISDEIEEHRFKAKDEEERARELFEKVQDLGAKLPKQVMNFVSTKAE